MDPRTLFIVLPALAGAGCATVSAQESALPKEIAKMSQAPSSSRPAPPRVAAVVHEGVRYEQDMQSSRHGGDQQGGYLVAVDPASGERLWMLKVYEIPAQPGAPIQPARHFRSMRLSEDGRALEIESVAGGKYRVDLAARTSTWLSGPDSVHQREIK